MNKDLSSILLEQQRKLEEQEKMYIVCGRYYRKHNNQERATFFFARANQAYKNRMEIQERLTLILNSIGVSIPQSKQFVKPISL